MRQRTEVMPREDKLNKIMQAAEKLFTSRRLHEITLDDVARLARVGKGTIYTYFKDKDDLFFQTAMQGFEDLCDLCHRFVPTKAPFAEQLEVVCSQVSDFFQRRRQLLSMMQAEEGRMRWCSDSMRKRWMERRECLVAAVAAVIRAGVTEGQVRDDISPSLLANFLLGLLRTRARDLTDRFIPDEGLAMVIEMFLNGAGRGGVPDGLTKGESI